MFRMRIWVASCVAFAVACSSSPPAPPDDPAPPQIQPQADQTAVGLGVAIDARDDRGAPRLVRAIVPRPATGPTGAGAMPAEAAARDHLTALTPLWLTHERPAELRAHAVQRLANGASVVRFQQRVDNVVVHHGELRVMLQADGSLVAVSGTMRSSSGRTAFRSTAVAAVERALDARFGDARTRPAITESAAKPGDAAVPVAIAANPEFQVEAARVRRELLPEAGRLVPIWSVELVAAATGAAADPALSGRRYLIDDADGRVRRDTNLTSRDAFVYRVFADPTGTRNPLDGPLASYLPHPTGTPDGTLPGAGPDNLVVIQAFNAPQDPWLGPAATTTSGNNVEAFADLTLPVGYNEGDIRPVVRGGRTLNYRYDVTAEPLATPAQSMASAVNAFFVTNWLHDWYYDAGFTEATGNAQVDNYGRGGVAGDPVIVHAQAGGTLDYRDNANMTTPEDGMSPVMNMFLWSPRVESSLVTATASVATAGIENGPRNFDLSGELAWVEDAVDGTHLACGEVTSSVAGKIALVEFTGACGIDAAMANVEAAGAIGIVAIFGGPGEGPAPIGGPLGATLPGLVVGHDDGAALGAALPAQVTLHRTTSVEHDGDLDNSIVSHEWGHYLHQRLAFCDADACSAMSEGWGDFVALHMLLRETDDREGTFGLGTYALSAGGMAAFGYADPGYFGIRRFPYSRNRGRNGLSFRHIGDDQALPDAPTNPAPASFPNSEPHNAGEVWAAMLWEVYNVLIDEHGFTDARRRMSEYVVAGLLLTPPNASYTEGRDALLAAAGAIDADDGLLMAAAFAGRGAGTCAVSPAPDAFDFSGVVESGTVAARLATSSATLTDDGASCDHDGYLDPGETGMLRITIANHGAIAAEDVVVRPTTITPGVTFGKPVNLALLPAMAQAEISIPVKIAATAPTLANLDIVVHVDGAAGCDTGHLAVELHQLLGVDEAPAVATADHFETGLVGWTSTGASAEQLWRRRSDGTTNHVMFGVEADFTSDTQLVSPVLQVSASEPLVVTAQHAYALEWSPFFGRFFDGGVVEVSSDGGATWRDVRELGVDPGYPATILEGIANPLAGRPAFSGESPAFPARDSLRLDFGTRFAGQAIQIRFRLGTDACCAAAGWELDDIAVSGITNAPFPGVIAEPTRCTARAAASAVEDSTVDLREMPRASRAGVSRMAAR